MSKFYLCETCAKFEGFDPFGASVLCDGQGHAPVVIVDHHGRDGVRYEDPHDVCGDYENGLENKL